MNIPSISLVWNNKLKLFGECIRKIWNQTYQNTGVCYKEQIIVSIKKIFKILGW